MSKLTSAGIRRGGQFSPNHIDNDVAIFTLTTQHLRKLGRDVNEYIESDLLLQDPEEKGIFGIVKDWRSIHKLRELGDKNYFVMNSSYEIGNCTREKMTRLPLFNHTSRPANLILRADENPTEALEKTGFSNCQVKRGDFHAVHREDVTYVRNPEEARNILKEYATHGIPSAVINEHPVGDLVKFYGVTGTGLFYWFCPSDIHCSKFGLEVINGTAEGILFDGAQLRLLYHKAAEVLNIHTYGGDYIVSEDGVVRIINFNDWPSFAPYREEAASNIACRIWDLIQEHI